VASAHGHVDIVQYLVESKGVPIPIDSPDNPLQLARANGNDEVTKYLSLQVGPHEVSFISCCQINKLSLGELLENMNDPVILVKNATTIVGFNKSAEALLGFQKQQVS
jgi:PAS domain-containing protein